MLKQGRNLLWFVIILMSFGPMESLVVYGEPLRASFSYQGVLEQLGQPAEGLFDFRFEVFDASSEGQQMGPLVIHEEVQVSEGLFHVELDFGNEILLDRTLWIEVGVREGVGTGSDPFTTLSPRQSLHQFSLNGKEASLSVPLTGLVTKTAFNSTIIGSGTVFTQELSEQDSILIAGEVFTVTSIQNDTLLEVEPSPESSVLEVVGFRDDTFFRVRAGDGQEKFVVDREGVTLGGGGTPISRIELGTIGDCGSTFSSGFAGGVTFAHPFRAPPRVFLTPLVPSIGCTSLRLSSVSEEGFGWGSYVGSSLYSCNCIFWLAIGSE